MTTLAVGDRVKFLAPGWKDDRPGGGLPLRGRIKKVRIRPPGYEVQVDYLIGRCWFELDEVEIDDDPF